VDTRTLQASWAIDRLRTPSSTLRCRTSASETSGANDREMSRGAAAPMLAHLMRPTLAAIAAGLDEAGVRTPPGERAVETQYREPRLAGYRLHPVHLLTLRRLRIAQRTYRN